MSATPPPDWAALETRYKQDIEALTESAEMAAIEKEIAEEKLDTRERELQEVKDKLAEAILKIDTLHRESQMEPAVGSGTSDSTVTVLQLQKVEEQNELLKQALIKLRDMSAKDKKALDDLQIEHEELQIKSLDFQEKEQKYLEQIKIYEEQIDVSQSAQEMVEKLTQQKTELEDKLRDMIEDLDCMEKLRDMNEELLESARQNEIELTGEIDKLRVKCAELTTKRHDMEYYLTDQEKTVAKLKDDNRVLSEELGRLKDQFKEGESIEQQKHQIENVAYKLNFSESRMAEKEAEVARYKRNLSDIEEQMNNLSIITKEQSTRLDELKLQYETKVSENSELQRALKKKMEEVSELEIRRDMAEKKLQSIQKDKDGKIATLTRQIETMKGMEIQHEEDMKRLMEDNELIERERRELRDQLNRSFRSLERTTQSVANASMVTAQDTSLASLGISLHSTPPVQSPFALQSPQQHLPKQQSVPAQTSILAAESSIPVPSGHISAAISPLNTNRRLFHTSGPIDESITTQRVRDLSTAFDQMSKRNRELEMELAATHLENGLPLPTCADLAQVYDIDKTRSLRVALDKLKREIRAAIINQQICPRSRNVNAHVRNDQFNAARLAMKCQALEIEAKSLLSTSSLTRSQPSQPLLQSTPLSSNKMFTKNRLSVCLIYTLILSSSSSARELRKRYSLPALARKYELNLLKERLLEEIRNIEIDTRASGLAHHARASHDDSQVGLRTGASGTITDQKYEQKFARRSSIGSIGRRDRMTSQQVDLQTPSVGIYSQSSSMTGSIPSKSSYAGCLEHERRGSASPHEVMNLPLSMRFTRDGRSAADQEVCPQKTWMTQPINVDISDRERSKMLLAELVNLVNEHPEYLYS